MNYADIKNFDIANGEGIRVSLFVSGCTTHCKGCFNQAQQSFDYGQPFTKDTLNHLLDLCSHSNIRGLSLLGGDPLHPNNVREVKNIIQAFRNKFSNSKDIWMWTGYTLADGVEPFFKENMKWNYDDLRYILMNVDVLVDGPFIEEKKDLNLQFRGSSNQRIHRKNHYE